MIDFDSSYAMSRFAFIFADFRVRTAVWCLPKIQGDLLRFSFLPFHKQP